MRRWGRWKEQQGGDDEKRESRGGMHGRRDCEAFTVGIKGRMPYSGNAGLKRLWAGHWQVTASLMSLQKANAHFFPLKLCPRTAGPLCKAGCQLIDVSVASSITQISSSLPLCVEVTAFHPETADKCETGNFFPPLALSVVSNKALKKMSHDLLKSLFSFRLQTVCGACWAEGELLLLGKPRRLDFY